MCGDSLRHGHTVVHINNAVPHGLRGAVNAETADVMELHGEPIAAIIDGTLWVTNGGWDSNLTRERLNGLPGVKVNKRKGVQLMNGYEWTGQWFKVRNL
jgi:hypothetical protein